MYQFKEQINKNDDNDTWSQLQDRTEEAIEIIQSTMKK